MKICKKVNGVILKNETIKDFGDSINLLNESMIFYDQHISPSNIYVRGGIAFLVILFGKEHSSPPWCIKYKSPSKH